MLQRMVEDSQGGSATADTTLPESQLVQVLPAVKALVTRRAECESQLARLQGEMKQSEEARKRSEELVEEGKAYLSDFSRQSYAKIESLKEELTAAEDEVDFLSGLLGQCSDLLETSGDSEAQELVATVRQALSAEDAEEEDSAAHDEH